MQLNIFFLSERPVDLLVVPMTTTTTANDISDDLMSVYLGQWKALLGALHKRTGSRDLAEDALQETWLRLAGMRGDQTAIRDRHAFILRVAANIAIDLARKEMRHAARCTSDDALVGTVADDAPSPETIVVDRDRLRVLVLALGQLPPKPRAALLLNRCDGLPHREIAARLGVSESMVARYLAQALRHCRDHFRSIS